MKKIISLLLVCAVVFGVIPIVGTKAEAAGGYGSNGKFLAPIDAPASGSIPISTKEELEAIAGNLKRQLSSDNRH